MCCFETINACGEGVQDERVHLRLRLGALHTSLTSQ